MSTCSVTENVIIIIVFTKASGYRYSSVTTCVTTCLVVHGATPAAGYKGYGLAMMVEVMCGMLGGGTYAHHVRKWSREEHRVANLVCMNL